MNMLWDVNFVHLQPAIHYINSPWGKGTQFRRTTLNGIGFGDSLIITVATIFSRNQFGCDSVRYFDGGWTL